MRFGVGEEVRQFHGFTDTAVIVECKQKLGGPALYKLWFPGFDVEDKWVEEHQITDAPSHSVAYRENYYQSHLHDEHWGDDEYNDDPAHPDGCFWCGSYNHPSDTCWEKDDSYWEGV